MHRSQQGRKTVQRTADLELQLQCLPSLLMYACPMHPKHVASMDVNTNHPMGMRYSLAERQV